MPIKTVYTYGKVPVKVWTDDIEHEAVSQLVNCANMPFIHKHVAAMPDVHAGRGATVGSVIPTYNAIIPAAVGVDLGCVDADTEFLTNGNGWKKISEYTEGDEVLVFNLELDECHWETPKNYIKDTCDEFYHIKTKYGVDQMVSSDHKILYYKFDRDCEFEEPGDILAEDLVDHHTKTKLGFRGRIRTDIPLKKELNEENLTQLTSNDLKLLVAIVADGHLDNRTKSSRAVTFRFSKVRKINRLLYLLSISDKVEVVTNLDEIKKMLTSYEDKDILENPVSIRVCVKNVFLFTKTFTDLWKLPSEKLSIVAEECLFWDGNEKERCFYSRDRENADFIQYASAVSGKRAVLRVDSHYRDNKPDYRVFQNYNTKVGISGSPKTNIDKVKSADGFKYCFTTSTGYWIMRRNGHICITGNCGMAAVRTNLTANDMPDNLGPLRASIENLVPLGAGGQHDYRLKVDIKPVQPKWNEFHKGFAKRLDLITAKHPNIFAKMKNPGSTWRQQLGSLGSGK